ncbi:MAG TPA: STAS domain-containing protein [Candidatus Limnocylindrales bacterium]|nr:STAS domain-containing protein [Candidatus Limnocylindrales bacterium]
MTTTTIDRARIGDVAILRIAGDVTSASEGDLTGGFGAALDDGARAVVLDFGAMEYMNSGGIGLLVTLLVRAQRAGARLLAIGLSDHYRQILALTRLDEAIEILPDEAAALAAVSA